MPIERELAIPGARPGSPAARAVATYLARLAPSSRRAVLGRLRAVAPVVGSPGGEVAWHAFGSRQLAQLRDQLHANGMSPPMINLTLIVLRGVAAAAADIGLITQAAAADLKSVRGISVPHDLPAPGRVVQPSDVAALFAVCWQDRSIAGVRDLAIMQACPVRVFPMPNWPVFRLGISPRLQRSFRSSLLVWPDTGKYA